MTQLDCLGRRRCHCGGRTTARFFQRARIYRLECIQCGAKGPGAVLFDGALQAWNREHTPPHERESDDD